ncbi:MAG: recombination protein RecR [Candidatus Omnitrophica bacterium]|nr:recombination protein RecR [Candidatus Omnitrophota bacterium]
MSYPRLIENFIERLMRLPGIGRRSAERIIFWFLNHSLDDAQGLAEAVLALKNGLHFCRNCNHLSEAEECVICLDEKRDKSILCVVEDPKDVLAIERAGFFRGTYHVLLGSINPSEGRGPEDLKILHLLDRVRVGNIQEVIIATDADSDGEMTALYLSKQLRNLGVKVSRIGVGIPVGSCIEFADLSTLTMSLTSRREINE